MSEIGKKKKIILFASAFIAGIAALFVFSASGENTADPMRTVSCTDDGAGNERAQAQAEDQVNCLFVSCSGFL